MIDMKDGRGLTTFSRQFLKTWCFSARLSVSQRLMDITNPQSSSWQTAKDLDRSQQHLGIIVSDSVIQQLLTLHDIWTPSLAIELLQGYFWNQTYLFRILNRCTASNWSSTRTPGSRIGHPVLKARWRWNNQLLCNGYMTKANSLKSLHIHRQPAMRTWNLEKERKREKWLKWWYILVTL